MLTTVVAILLLWFFPSPRSSKEFNRQAQRQAIEKKSDGQQKVYKIFAFSSAGGRILNADVEKDSVELLTSLESSRSDTVQIEMRKPVTLEVAPIEGFYISSLTIDGKKIKAASGRSDPFRYEFSPLTADHRITAMFVSSRKRYRILLSSGAGGEIVAVSSFRSGPAEQPTIDETDHLKNDSIFVYEGETKYFAIIPAAGYDLDRIIVDGKPWSQTWNGLGLNQYRFPIYQFENIEKNHVIKATFIKE